MNTWEAIAVPFILLGIVIAVFFAGRHSGAAGIQGEWDAQKIVDERALNDERARQERAASRYATQIQDADRTRDELRARIAALASSPHPHLLCHAAEGGSGVVSGVPKAAGSTAPAAGALPPGSDFDPSGPLYAQVADPADAIVEACRDLQNRLPKGE